MVPVLKVFIVDDSALVRERLAALVSELAFIELVGQAQNGQEAIPSIQRLRPDVVILDIRMPGDGLHVLEAIKRETGTPVVIVLTAFPDPQCREKCVEAGAEHFLNKATEFDRVTDVLEELHRSRRSG